MQVGLLFSGLHRPTKTQEEKEMKKDVYFGMTLDEARRAENEKRGIFVHDTEDAVHQWMHFLRIGAHEIAHRIEWMIVLVKN